MASRDHSVECERCGYQPGDDEPCDCDSDYRPHAYWIWPSCLASNLAIGALGCAAFGQGDEYAMEREALYEQRMAPHQRKQLLAKLWRPGHAITRASAQMEENGES